MNAVDQPIAHRRVNIVSIDCRNKSRRIFPGTRIEYLLLDLAVVKSRPCIRKFTVARVELLEGLPAQFSVRRHLQRYKATVGEPDLIAGAVLYRRKLEISVGKHSKAVGRGLRRAITSSGMARISGSIKESFSLILTEALCAFSCSS